MSNVNVPALRRIEKTLEDYGIAYYVDWQGPGSGGGFRPRKKWMWSIQIAGAKRVKRFLDLIGPFLVVKAEQAEIVRKWTTWVVERPRNVKQNTVRGLSTNQNKYLDEDRKVKAQVSALNQNPQRLYAEHENRYVNDNKYLREDIVRPEMKVSEMGRNDLSHSKRVSNKSEADERLRVQDVRSAPG